MAHDLTHTDDMDETQQQTDTATADAPAYTCEMCDKPAEVLAATEQDGGMSPVTVLFLEQKIENANASLAGRGPRDFGKIDIPF